MPSTITWTDAPSMAGREPSRANLASYLTQVDKYLGERALLDSLLDGTVEHMDPADPDKQAILDEDAAYFKKEAEFDNKTRLTLKEYEDQINQWGLEIPTSVIHLMSRPSQGNAASQQQSQSQPQTSVTRQQFPRQARR